MKREQDDITLASFERGTMQHTIFLEGEIDRLELENTRLTEGLKVLEFPLDHDIETWGEAMNFARNLLKHCPSLPTEKG